VSREFHRRMGPYHVQEREVAVGGGLIEDPAEIADGLVAVDAEEKGELPAHAIAFPGRTWAGTGNPLAR